MQSEFRHARSGSLTIGAQNGQPPQGQGQQQQGQGPQPGQQPHDATSPMPGAQARFDGPRSPPNTSHVPCKFFRQGACQAGNSCPFSHDIGTAIETVCKYFAKGNCKFGPKCANMHLLPDGRRVTYGKNGVIIGTAPVGHVGGPGGPGGPGAHGHGHNLGLGNRVNPAAYMQPSNSALTNSFIAQQQQQPGAGQQQQQQPQDFEVNEYTSNPTSAYGSPPGPGLSGAFADDLHSSHNGATSSLGQALRQAQAQHQHQQGGQTPQQQHRSLLGLSPMNANVLSVMDAPLPASFDSNGISHAARYGPWPSSVPSKFGLESPTPSLHNAKDERTSETLKLLHTSAFGDHLSPSNLSGLLGAQQAQAHLPKTSSLLNGSALDDFGGKRIMHSSSTRYAKPRLLSSSVPKVDRDWDTEFWFLEEDYVPANLANEVLTPQEKARRGSIRLTEPSGGALDAAFGETPTQSASATKFGSPANNGNGAGISGSPSRWSPWLQQRQRSSGAPMPSSSYGATGGPFDDDFEPGSVGRSMKHAASAFGHVGSPLRNSSLAAGAHAELNGKSNGASGFGSGSLGGSLGGDFGGLSSSLGGRGSSFGFGGPSGASASASGGESMLSQQLQRTRLEDDDKLSERSSPSGLNPSRLRPSAARNPSASLSQAAVTQAAAAGIIGSSGAGTSTSGSGGRFPAPIDEEDPSFLFDMEEVDESKQKNGTAAAVGATTASATKSAAAPAAPAATPATSSLWGYANIVKGNGASGNASNGAPTKSG